MEHLTQWSSASTDVATPSPPRAENNLRVELLPVFEETLNHSWDCESIKSGVQKTTVIAK
jgi:hypothetical protein